MADDRDQPDGEPPATRFVPALPRALAEPTPVVLFGTMLWLGASLALGIMGWLGDGLDVAFWTCVAGSVLGITGFGIFRWQRSASRRGSRGAWKGLSGLDH